MSLLIAWPRIFFLLGKLPQNHKLQLSPISNSNTKCCSCRRGLLLKPISRLQTPTCNFENIKEKRKPVRLSNEKSTNASTLSLQLSIFASMIPFERRKKLESGKKGLVMKPMTLVEKHSFPRTPS